MTRKSEWRECFIRRICPFAQFALIIPRSIAIDIFALLLYSIPVQIWETFMTIQTNYTQARASLAKLLDEVTKNRQVVIIQRRGQEDVALVSAEELESLLETAYLLRSPKNAERLLSALGRALRDESSPLTLEGLRREVGLESHSA